MGFFTRSVVQRRTTVDRGLEHGSARFILDSVTLVRGGVMHTVAHVAVEPGENVGFGGNSFDGLAVAGDGEHFVLLGR